MLFLMVMLLSLLCAVAGDSFGGAGYVLSGVLAGLAFLIKQPGIAVPIAVLLILLYRKKLRTAAVFTLSAVLPVVLVFGVLLWHRGPFLEQFGTVGECVWSLREGTVFAVDRLSQSGAVYPHRYWSDRVCAGYIGGRHGVVRRSRRSPSPTGLSVFPASLSSDRMSTTSFPV